jgi:glycosyltransferase involved in cell wall biosynthesis
MNILFLTFHFEPDLSAGAFKNTPLVKELLSKMNSNDTIEVITTMPNRYLSFKNEALFVENQEGLSIHRIEIPAHKNGLIDQIQAFSTFYFKVRQITKDKKYDLVYASSSKLFTAYLGVRIAKSSNIPLYLDIRDIFVDNLKDVLKNKPLKYVLLPFLRYIERYTIESANHLNLVSKGFEPYFDYFNGPKTFFSNGIDKIFLSVEFQNNFSKSDKNTPQIITYAGNIGEGQGLEKILPQVAKNTGNNFYFRIIGDGGTKIKLEAAIKKFKVNNIEVLPPVSRESLKAYYLQSDYLFLHLNDYEAFKKVLPSKIFEYGATNKPIIAGVSGYARDFIEEHLENSIIFDPGDISSLTQQLLTNRPAVTNRKEFIEKFPRSRILSEMSDSILKLAIREEL